MQVGIEQQSLKDPSEIQSQLLALDLGSLLQYLMRLSSVIEIYFGKGDKSSCRSSFEWMDLKCFIKDMLVFSWSAMIPVSVVS